MIWSYGQLYKGLSSTPFLFSNKPDDCCSITRVIADTVNIKLEV